MRYPYRADAAHKTTGKSCPNGVVSTSLAEARKQLEEDGYAISSIESILTSDERAIARAEYERMQAAVFWGIFKAMAMIAVALIAIAIVYAMIVVAS